MIRACDVRRSTTRALSSDSRLVVSSARATAAWMPANALSARTEIGSSTSPAGSSASATAKFSTSPVNGARISANGGASRSSTAIRSSDRQREVRDQVGEVLPGRDVRGARQQPREPAALVRDPVRRRQRDPEQLPAQPALEARHPAPEAHHQHERQPERQDRDAEPDRQAGEDHRPSRTRSAAAPARDRGSAARRIHRSPTRRTRAGRVRGSSRSPRRVCGAT